MATGAISDWLKFHRNVSSFVWELLHDWNVAYMILVQSLWLTVKPSLMTNSIKQLLLLCHHTFNFPSQYISY